MSWLSRLWSRFRNERTLVMPPPQWGVRALPVFEAGAALTVDEAIRVSVVWACMDVLVRSIAPRPWRVYDFDGEKRSLRRNDPLSYLLNTRPNPQMTAIAFREALQYSAIGWGNGYAEIVPNGRGEPAELWPIDPDRCIPWRDESTGEVGYRIYPYVGGIQWVPGRRIFHLRGPASYNGIAGDNLLVRASRAIAIAAAAQQFSASFFANGTILSGVIEMDAKIPDKNIVDDLRRQWVEKYAGRDNAGGPLVLHGGAKWKEVQADPNKSQLLDTRKFQVEEIARYFGVPLQKIQVTQGAHGYGSNIEQLGIEFVRDTLRPWAERLEQEADYKLVAPMSNRSGTRETKIDLSELTQGDLASQVKAIGAAVQAGLLTRNEGRAHFGWNNTGPDGDIFMVPNTMKTVEQLLEPPEPPAPQLPPKAPPATPQKPKDALALEAIAAIYAGALERYAKRIANRRADLERKAPEKVESNLAAERERWTETVRGEVAWADRLLLKAGFATPNGELPAFLAAVEQGEPPDCAARRLVENRPLLLMSEVA